MLTKLCDTINHQSNNWNSLEIKMLLVTLSEPLQNHRWWNFETNFPQLHPNLQCRIWLYRLPNFIEPTITWVSLGFSRYISVAQKVGLQHLSMERFQFQLSRGFRKHIVCFTKFINLCMTFFYFEISATGCQSRWPSRRRSRRRCSD